MRDVIRDIDHCAWAKYIIYSASLAWTQAAMWV